jgi:hypothetical protein
MGCQRDSAVNILLLEIFEMYRKHCPTKILKSIYQKFLVCAAILSNGFVLNGNSQSFSCDIALTCSRIDNETIETKPDFTGNLHLDMDYSSGKWSMNYSDNNQKFVFYDGNFILERPNYNASNAWYIVSSPNDSYPIDLDFDQRLVWFIYCAKNYLLQRQGQPVILPFGDARADSYVHGCRFNGKWLSDSQSCPDTAEFSFDSQLFQDGIKQLSFESDATYLKDREKQFMDYSHGNTNGEVLARFQVTEWADAGGLKIPTAWNLDLYWYAMHSFQCTGTARNIQINHETVNFPVLSKIAVITDKRVRNAGFAINSVHYQITDGQIPKSIQDIKIPKSSVNNNFTQMPPDLKKTRAFFTILILATIIVPLPFLLRRKRPPSSQG